jgi:hypothetical protein
VVLHTTIQTFKAVVAVVLLQLAVMLLVTVQEMAELGLHTL